MNEILKNCKNKTKNIDSIAYWNLIPVSVHSSVFRDRIVLLATDQNKLQKMVNIWTEELQKNSLKINIKKTKVMKITHRRK
jgi:hypothetical protein